ncbi:MAG TPA: RCC1 domain-containing protein [Archangium sp.]|nr:RCC1 domain-containing protein [Archangium sp.]
MTQRLSTLPRIVWFVLGVLLVPGGARSQPVGVSAGAWHSLRLSPGGTVCAWGDNAQGQLGDGIATPRGASLPSRSLASQEWWPSRREPNTRWH